MRDALRSVFARACRITIFFSGLGSLAAEKFVQLKDDYPKLESNLHQNYFACEPNCAISRFNSSARYL